MMPKFKKKKKFGTKVLSQWYSTKLYFIEGSKDLLDKCIIDQNFLWITTYVNLFSVSKNVYVKNKVFAK